MNDLIIVATTTVKVDAGCEQDDSFEAVSEEGIVALGEAVDHLACTLGVANVRKLGLASLCEDLANVGRLVISSHLGPGEVPPLCVSPGTVAIVDVAVLGTTIAAHPNVEASIDELQGPDCRGCVAFLRAPLGPCASIHAKAVLDKYWYFFGHEAFYFTIFNFSSDSEEGQRPAIGGLGRV